MRLVDVIFEQNRVYKLDKKSKNYFVFAVLLNFYLSFFQILLPFFNQNHIKKINDETQNINLLKVFNQQAINQEIFTRQINKIQPNKQKQHYKKMPTEQSKLYRSNIQYQPITINGLPKLNESIDFLHQSQQLSPQRKIYHQNSQKSLKTKHQRSTQQGTKQSLPQSNLNEIENTTFISIDEVYLNPKFSKTNKPNDNRILNNNLIQLQSDAGSIAGKSIRSFQGQDQYYKYWKTKAHQYLDENFKLREENKKLKSQLQILQKAKINVQLQTKKTPNNDQAVKKGEKNFLYLQNIFKKKLNELQNQLKQKNQKIVSLEDKLLQLNRKLLGQEQRTHLIERLGKQIDTLTQQNISLKKLQYQYQNQQRKNHFQEVDDNKYRSPYAKYRSKQKSTYGSNRRSYEKLANKNRI